MSAVRPPLASALVFLALSTPLFAQTPPPTVPRTFWFTGVVHDASGQPRTGATQVLFAIYKDADGGVPLAQELQTVTLDAEGRYGVLLGSTLPDGLPLEVFSTGEARWIGVQPAGGPELPRVALISVPYALKAADADTLGGKPLAAFVLTDPSTAGGSVLTGPATRTTAVGTIVPPVSGTGTTNQVTKWVDTAGTLADSAISEVGGNVGIGTTAPNGQLHVFGAATADVFAGMGPNLIVGPAFSFGYAGSSFGQSAGFFNVRPDASAVAPNPSLRFLTGNVQRMIISNLGNVGIGTTGAPPDDVRLTVDGGGNVGVLGRSTGDSSPGVLGKGSGSGSGAFGGVGVKGVSDNGFAVWGNSTNGLGVLGVSVNAAAMEGLSTNYPGVIGESTGSYGVLGISTSNVGVYGVSETGLAGYFLGDVTVTGTLTKGGGSFKIDHPMDPENKYLSHSFVESPDMLNVYNGNITLDAQGEAWVVLPEWFEALNRDFRYQLTPIGAPANLYIAEEVAGNRFKIAGGSAGGRVSWQVTGVRHDRWADAHRVPVEESKPESERGFYLHPDVFGQPDSKALPSAHGAREPHARATSVDAGQP